MNDFSEYSQSKPFSEIEEGRYFLKNSILYIKTGNIITSTLTSNAQVVRIGRQLDIEQYQWFDNNNTVLVKQ